MLVRGCPFALLTVMMLGCFDGGFLRQQAAMPGIYNKTGHKGHDLTDKVYCVQNGFVRVNAAFSQRCQQAWTEVAGEFGSA